MGRTRLVRGRVAPGTVFVRPIRSILLLAAALAVPFGACGPAPSAAPAAALAGAARLAFPPDGGFGLTPMPTEGWTETAVRFMPDYALALPPGLVEDTTARFMHGGRRWQGPDNLVVNEMYGMWSETSFADADTVAAHG